MWGIKSNGMLLAASNDAHGVAEPLAPPAGAAPGSRVWFGDARQQAPPMEWVGGDCRTLHMHPRHTRPPSSHAVRHTHTVTPSHAPTVLAFSNPARNS
jgi:hypothetical protein